MSTLPEAKLAREAEIAYTLICMSTDYDCWHETGESVTVEMVMGNMRANSANARRFVGEVLDELAKPEYADLIQAKHLEGLVKGCVSYCGGGKGFKGEGEDELDVSRLLQLTKIETN